MKTIEERADTIADRYVDELHQKIARSSAIESATEQKAIDEYGLDKDELKESIKQFYKEEKVMQKTIERDTLNEIYDLYSKLIDDLYDGYLESGWNMGIVDINGEERNMGEMLDLLNNKFRKAMEE